MTQQMRPSSKANAPDPSDAYERSHPEHESGQGRLDNNSKATPTPRPDKMAASVSNAQDGSKQINAHDNVSDEKADREQTGWENALNIDDIGTKKHPK